MSSLSSTHCREGVVWRSVTGIIGRDNDNENENVLFSDPILGIGMNCLLMGMSCLIMGMSCLIMGMSCLIMGMSGLIRG